MDASQIGNNKGVSVDHYLIKMLDKILSDLDGKGESRAVIATLVDWSKAFPRLDSTLGINNKLVHKKWSQSKLDPNYFLIF